jgi:hypothetical protein
MNADALREALGATPDSDTADDGDDPVTAAGRVLGEKLDLDEEGMDALAEFVAAVAAEGR